MKAKLLAILQALEQAFPPGVSYPEDNSRHHALMVNTYGDRVELGLHLWVAGVSQCLFLDDQDLECPPDVLVEQIRTLLHLDGDVQVTP